MEEGENPFNEFLIYLFIFAFVTLYYGAFKADIAKGNSAQNVAKNTVQTVQPIQQTVYRQVYVNYGGGPATVYYVRQ